MPSPIRTSTPRTRSPRLLTALALTISAGAAQATITVYTSEAAYLAALDLATIGADSFDDLGSATQASATTRAAGFINYRVVVSGGYRGQNLGSSDHWLATASAASSATLNNYSASVRAIGAYIFATDGSGAVLPGVSMAIGVTDNLGATFSYSLVNPSASSYVGIVSTQGLSTFTAAVSSFSYVTLNNLTMASKLVSSVPEAGSGALLLGGLALLPCALRRRRARRT